MTSRLLTSPYASLLASSSAAAVPSSSSSHSRPQSAHNTKQHHQRAASSSSSTASKPHSRPTSAVQQKQKVSSRPTSAVQQKKQTATEGNDDEKDEKQESEKKVGVEKKVVITSSSTTSTHFSRRPTSASRTTIESNHHTNHAHPTPQQPRLNSTDRAAAEVYQPSPMLPGLIRLSDMKLKNRRGKSPARKEPDATAERIALERKASLLSQPSQRQPLDPDSIEYQISRLQSAAGHAQRTHNLSQVIELRTRILALSKVVTCDNISSSNQSLLTRARLSLASSYLDAGMHEQVLEHITPGFVEKLQQQHGKKDREQQLNMYYTNMILGKMRYALSIATASDEDGNEDASSRPASTTTLIHKSPTVTDQISLTQALEHLTQAQAYVDSDMCVGHRSSSSSSSTQHNHRLTLLISTSLSLSDTHESLGQYETQLDILAKCWEKVDEEINWFNNQTSVVSEDINTSYPVFPLYYTLGRYFLLHKEDAVNAIDNFTRAVGIAEAHADKTGAPTAVASPDGMTPFNISTFSYSSHILYLRTLYHLSKAYKFACDTTRCIETYEKLKKCVRRMGQVNGRLRDWCENTKSNGMASSLPSSSILSSTSGCILSPHYTPSSLSTFTYSSLLLIQQDLLSLYQELGAGYEEKVVEMQEVIGEVVERKMMRKGGGGGENSLYGSDNLSIGSAAPTNPYTLSYIRSQVMLGFYQHQTAKEPRTARITYESTMALIETMYGLKRNATMQELMWKEEEKLKKGNEKAASTRPKSASSKKKKKVKKPPPPQPISSFGGSVPYHISPQKEKNSSSSNPTISTYDQYLLAQKSEERKLLPHSVRKILKQLRKEVGKIEKELNSTTTDASEEKEDDEKQERKEQENSEENTDEHVVASGDNNFTSEQQFAPSTDEELTILVVRDETADEYGEDDDFEAAVAAEQEDDEKRDHIDDAPASTATFNDQSIPDPSYDPHLGGSSIYAEALILRTAGANEEEAERIRQTLYKGFEVDKQELRNDAAANKRVRPQSAARRRHE